MRTRRSKYGAAVLLVAALVWSVLACGGLGGGSEVIEADRACFGHCEVGPGSVSRVCTADAEELGNQDSCEQVSRKACGGEPLSRAELVEGCDCSTPCEPDWFR